MQLSFDPVTVLLDLYPREIRTYIHTKLGMQMFTAVLLIILQTTQMSCNKRIINHTVVHPHHGTLFSNKKEGPSKACNNLVDLQRAVYGVTSFM